MFNTLKCEQKIAYRYLFFGKLSIYQIQNILGSNCQANTKTLQSQKNILNQSLSSEKNEAKIIKDNFYKEKYLDDVALELTQDIPEVLLSQVLIQFLKLNSKFEEQASQVLEITIFFVNKFK